jgi:hypothetical protein
MAVRPRSVAASMWSLSFWYLVNQRSLPLNLIDLIRRTMRRTYPSAPRPANGARLGSGTALERRPGILPRAKR